MASKIWKYCYWFNAGLFAVLKKQLQEKGIYTTEAKQNPCESMLGEIGCAGPHTWSAICKYDALPWYGKSAFKDKILVVSSCSLGNEYEQHLETTITPVFFLPPYMPTIKEKEELANNTIFQNKKPVDWDSFPKETGEQITLGLSKITGKPKGSWDSLFQAWTACCACKFCLTLLPGR